MINGARNGSVYRNLFTDRAQEAQSESDVRATAHPTTVIDSKLRNLIMMVYLYPLDAGSATDPIEAGRE